MAGITATGPTMRIGELATELGVTADTIRFYEKSGWLPGPRRAGNAYRLYGPRDVEHVRLLLELRRLDLPLPEAARVAGWCHSGHCPEATQALPTLLATQRRAVADRIERLRELDSRLARLERHLGGARARRLPVRDEVAPCCETAAAVEAGALDCACCAEGHDGAGTASTVTTASASGGP